MNAHDERLERVARAMKRLVILAAWWVLIVYCVALLWHLFGGGPAPPRYEKISEEEREWVKMRHRFHGIWYSEIGPDGEHFFWRDGRRVKL